jgi:aldehyde dehydrogenase (NAD+)
MQVTVQHRVQQDIEKSFASLRESSRNLRKEPIEIRIGRLKKLKEWIHKNRSAIHEAVYADFKKPPVEVDGTEIFHVLNEIKFAISNLPQWAAPRKVNAPFTMLGTRSFVQYEPRGLCLIISPWNYPFSLAAGPLVAALAAGNAVILKPSEVTPHVSSLIARMASDVFDKNVVTVFEGDAEISTALLRLPFDHIFFTGSPAIGRVVMQAAAEHLTSVTLELGGKCPAIVTESANLDEAAKRIVVAKFVNNGQTCVAPDYILIERSKQQEFVRALSKQTHALFKTGGQSFETSESYCRIVNRKHFNRLNEMLQEGLQGGAIMELGGPVDESTNYMHPVILTEVPLNTRLMNEEIFGPILPVVPYDSLDKAIDFVNSKPKPLALYIFSRRKSDHQQVLQNTSSGAVCINECAIHFLHHNLPFGGVNTSGIGSSHGFYGFQSFSHEKPVLKQKNGFTSIQAFYPPYTNLSRKIMDWFLKLF